MPVWWTKKKSQCGERKGKTELKLVKRLWIGITEGGVDGIFWERESSDEDTFDGTVQVDFAFFDPKESDFHGVKLLLQNYLGDKQRDLSPLVDLILGQTNVGTVVKAEDAEDDGLFPVVTALNLNRYKMEFCRGRVPGGKESIVFTKPEDEVFNELCSWFFNFPFHTAHVTPPELKNYRLMGLVTAIEAEKFPTFQQKLKS